MVIHYDYIDTEKLYKDFVVVYSRVSSAQQDIQKQIHLAEAYINNNNIDKDKVIWLKDNDVSATKLSLEQRPALNELRMLIKQKKVKTVIVYSRDRLARNFYEYVALVKEFYEHNVHVIFTSTKQPPFSEKLSIEALYGIFAQTEGQNISSRRSDTQKQYPSSIFGFQRVGKRKDVRFIPDPKVHNDLKSFFYEVIKSETAEDLFNVLMKYKKIFNNKSYEELLKYLQNPFYSGHMETLYGYEKLNHVEPIISFEDFLCIQNIIKKLKDEILNAIVLAGNNGILHPICSICKRKMAFRSTQLGKSGYYVCKKKHKEIKINVDEYNHLISAQLSDIIQSISTDAMKKDCFAYLKMIEKQYNQELIKLNQILKSLHQKITLSFSHQNKNGLDSLILESRKIKQQIENIHIELIKIDEARKGIKEHVQIIKENLVEEIKEYDLYFLCNLFFSAIEVSQDSLIYHVTFGKYIEDGEHSA
ncbi:recombinase family protein [Saccharococcus caldoxylosilyticus]|uniref:recombinase family protein n=1 Tax=Saccharococcus caldoxylosilyticus TaxID=81408 RepID=UPI0002F7371B|nr:recombinase family protein [Parageobacillus caldoxylosilyticus]